jgi:hypothetical protein
VVRVIVIFVSTTHESESFTLAISTINLAATVAPTTHASESFTLAISAINLAATVAPLRGLVGRDEDYAGAHLLTPTSEPDDGPYP